MKYIVEFRMLSDYSKTEEDIDQFSFDLSSLVLEPIKASISKNSETGLITIKFSRAVKIEFES